MVVFGVKKRDRKERQKFDISLLLSCGEDISPSSGPYMPLYDNKPPSEYVCTHLNHADNYCLTILHKNKEYNLDT